MTSPSPSASTPRRAPHELLGLISPAYGGDYNPEQWDEATFAEDLELMAEAGVNHGLTKADSTRIVAQAFAGSAQLLLRGLENGQVPANLIDRVSSPGGTTIAGLLAAQEAGLSSAIVAAVDAAVERDHHLG